MSRQAAAARHVLERLDQPVPDHALGLGTQHVERVGAGQRRVAGALQRQQPDLRAIAVRDDHLVVVQQRLERGGGAGHVRLLDVAVGPLAALQQRIAAQGRDYPHCGSPRRSPSVATMTALIVGIRLAACSNTTEFGDSKTSSVTSRASRPRLS